MTKREQPQFLGYLHSFRGFAIINIAMLHAIVAAVFPGNNYELDMQDPLTLTGHVLFGASTLYFAVISGLLFTAVLRSRGYAKFYKNKARFVVVPYIFFTALLSIFVFMDLSYALQPDLPSYLNAFGMNLIYGKAGVPYWYIPVLLLIYLLTPLAMKLLEGGKIAKLVFVCLMLSPLIISRAGDEILFSYAFSFKTVIYFMGGYAVGMLIGNDLNRSIAWIKNKFVWIALAASLSLLVLFYMFAYRLDPEGFVSLRQSLFYINKISLSCVFLYMFYALGDRQPRWLHRLAESAFTIYFIHDFFQFYFLNYFTPMLLWPAINPLNGLIGTTVIFLFSIICCLAIVSIFKKLLGRKSKMIIGS